MELAMFRAAKSTFMRHRSAATISVDYWVVKRAYGRIYHAKIGKTCAQVFVARRSRFVTHKTLRVAEGLKAEKPVWIWKRHIFLILGVCKQK